MPVPAAVLMTAASLTGRGAFGPGISPLGAAGLAAGLRTVGGNNAFRTAADDLRTADADDDDGYK